MDWIEEWFNSPYYHLLYSNRNEEEAESFIKRVSTVLKMQQGAKVLDAACGKGRHSRTLCRLGFDVTGIDLSANNIEFAKQFESIHLKFAVHDIREVCVENEFDYVFNLFSSFGYCDDEEDLKMLRAFTANLKPGGTLVLDYMNSEWVVKNMKPRDIVQRGDIQFHIQKKLENDFIKKKIEFIANGENHSYEEQLKLINLQKFKKMFTQASLVLQKTFGDYELNEFNSSISQRLIITALKA